jgi:hypothetical protein
MTTIEGDAALCACQQQLHPPEGASWKLHGRHALKQPVPVQPVVRLLKVEKQYAARLLLLLEIVNLLKVQQHVVCYVAAWHKRCLGAVYDAAHDRSKPQHQHLSNDLQVAVE